MDHARHRSDQTLGVGCFSVAQQDAIRDELDRLRLEDPTLEHFFMPSKKEPFFVKNLENIQGDERDVIFISIGYARDSAGYLAMDFGPLKNDGGERRLNVLITRARDCCRVFSSIRADDIDLVRAESAGAKALKTFLKYAETGLLDTGTRSGKDHDSEFERQVAEAIEKHGFKIEPQVGVAGFFIDLAVLDPNKPGRFVLGIECDGANYHRSRSARDRDRLRSAVLEERGWIIHRIWSTDWFQRPDEQLRKSIAAIEAAIQIWNERDKGFTGNSPAAPTSEEEIIREEGYNASNADSQIASQPYEVASFKVQCSSEIHEVSSSELARIVTRVVEVEGPIHEEEIARRVGQLWGVGRTGSRIREAVGQAINIAARTTLTNDGPFFNLGNRTEITIRDRGNVSISTV